MGHPIVRGTSNAGWDTGGFGDLGDLAAEEGGQSALAGAEQDERRRLRSCRCRTEGEERDVCCPHIPIKLGRETGKVECQHVAAEAEGEAGEGVVDYAEAVEGGIGEGGNKACLSGWLEGGIGYMKGRV